MVTKISVSTDAFDKPSQCTREVLAELILWLIRLRWIAVGGIVTAGLIGSYVFPVLTNAMPIYICAGALLLCNVFYLWVATKKTTDAGSKDTVLGMVQAEVDLKAEYPILFSCFTSFKSS
jgi:hypothetical protein